MGNNKELVQLAERLWVPKDFGKSHRYFADQEARKPYTGVTTVLGVLAKPALIGWAARMTAEWIRENCGEKVFQVGAGLKPTGNPIYMVDEDQLQEAVKAHTKKKEAGGQKGTDLHSEVEAWIKNTIATNTMEYSSLQSPGLKAFVKWACDNEVKFLASEKQVYHSDPSMWYAGTFDFSFEKDGKRFIGDLKTMKKLWDRTPFFQTAAYMMASEHMGEEPYDGSCIVNVSKETNELTDHWTFDHESDRKAFGAALTLYKALNN